MSRLIKFFSIQIQPPMIIESNNTPLSDDEGMADWYPGATDTAEKPDSMGETEQIRDQASEILQETEQMVRELIQTGRQEAEKIIKNAKEEASRIVAEGQENLRQIEEEAYRHGWQEGYKEGKRIAEDEYDAKLREAASLVEKAHEARQRIVAGSEDEIVQLAVAVARKIIGRELATDPDIIVDIVKRAIQKTTDREELTVRVNPENLDSTINAHDEIARSAKGVRKLKVLADPTVTPGGCVVETSNGTVDARIERQLSEIEQALTEVSPNA